MLSVVMLLLVVHQKISIICIERKSVKFGFELIVPQIFESSLIMSSVRYQFYGAGNLLQNPVA